jgi:glycosyltransferase involved in cell wall biosynthesis
MILTAALAARLKILEAVAMGQALVSTTVAAEGLAIAAEEHFVRADGPADFARAVVALLDDPDRRCTLGAAGHQLVKAAHSWEHVVREFERFCLETVSLATC